MSPFSTVWLLLMIMFLITEATTVTMVSLWFAGGSLAALIVALSGGSWSFQVLTALVVSTVLLACLRPIAQKYFTPKLTRTNVDAIIGSKGYVTADIDNMSATGIVKLGAMEWTARATNDEFIPKGALVKVDKIEGVKVFVSTVKLPTEII